MPLLRQTESVDLVEELRLRAWARANYVPAAERNSAWHPVLIDEMQRRDAEIGESEDFADAGPYVPLAAHEAHPRQAPRFLAAPVGIGEAYYA